MPDLAHTHHLVSNAFLSITIHFENDAFSGKGSGVEFYLVTVLHNPKQPQYKVRQGGVDFCYDFTLFRAIRTRAECKCYETKKINQKIRDEIQHKPQNYAHGEKL